MRHGNSKSPTFLANNLVVRESSTLSLSWKWSNPLSTKTIGQSLIASTLLWLDLLWVEILPSLLAWSIRIRLDVWEFSHQLTGFTKRLLIAISSEKNYCLTSVSLSMLVRKKQTTQTRPSWLAILSRPISTLPFAIIMI